MVARGKELKFFTLKWKMGGVSGLRKIIDFKMVEYGHKIPSVLPAQFQSVLNKKAW